MNRRDAIKGLGLSLGYVVATPTVVSMLQGCKTDANQWTPIFFTVDEGTVIRTLIDIMLPKTEQHPEHLMSIFLNFSTYMPLRYTLQNSKIITRKIFKK